MPKEEKKSKLPLVITIFIAFLMLTSVIGYLGFGSDVTVTKYNGFKVREFGNHVDLKIDGKYVPFTTHPADAASVDMDPAVMDALKGAKQVYLTFNPAQTQDYLQHIDYNRFEFANQLTQFNIYVIQGVTQSMPSAALPQITCNNATQFIPVIEFREAEDTKITKEGNCIILEALEPSDFLRLRERIIYGFYGVIS